LIRLAAQSADQGLLVIRLRADRDGDKSIQLSDHLPIGAFEAQIDAPGQPHHHMRG
jgi:hypothetical protein